MTAPTYQLIITHNNQIETLPLDDKNLLTIEAKSNTSYKVTKDGELLEEITTKTVGDDLYLIGSNDIDATGNDGNNILTGNDGNNILRGNGGNDILDGGRGSDTLIGSAGEDIFRFSSVLDGSVDKIDNFVVGEDKLLFDDSIFTILNDANIRNHIQYDSTSGELSYDSDGAGSINAIHFATLSAGLGANLIRYEII